MISPSNVKEMAAIPTTPHQPSELTVVFLLFSEKELTVLLKCDTISFCDGPTFVMDLYSRNFFGIENKILMSLISLV